MTVIDHPHVWERYRETPGCPCPRCEIPDPMRYLECSDCDAVLKERDSTPDQFEALWERATWP